MSYPTPEQLASMAKTLNTADWTKLVSRLTTAIERDRRGGSAIPDGYPRGRSSGGRTAPRHETHINVCYTVQGSPWTWSCVCGADSGFDLIPTRPKAEAAAQQHEDANATFLDYSDSTGETAISAGRVRDEHHDRTTNAVGYLQQAVQSLCALVTHLDRIEAKTVHVDGREPGCSNHARLLDHQGRPLFAERYRGDLCERCYRFKLEYGVVPPGTLIDDHARGIRWTSGPNGSIARALADGQACKR